MNPSYCYIGGYDFGTPPDLYSVLDKNEIEKNAKRFSRRQNKDDALEAERQARKHFSKVMALKHYTKELIEKEEMPLPVDEKIKQSALIGLKRKSPFCLLTINPKQDVKFEQFKKCVDKFLRKKTNKYWFQVYEVRKGESGLHSHIMLHYTQTPYDFSRSTKNTFKNICDVTNSAILNFKYIPEDAIPDKISYLLGEKQKKKEKGVEDTKKWRTKYNVEKFVESSPPFPCRATQKKILMID